MPIVRSSVLIQSSPERVAAVLLDPSLAPRWTAGLERLEVISGEPGVAGCVGHAHYREGRRRYVLEDVLEDVTPGRHYRSRITGGGISVAVETRLESVAPDATRLSLRWEGHGTTLGSKVMLPLLKRRIAQRMATDLAALHRLCESSNGV